MWAVQWRECAAPWRLILLDQKCYSTLLSLPLRNIWTLMRSSHVVKYASEYAICEYAPLSLYEQETLLLHRRNLRQHLSKGLPSTLRRHSVPGVVMNLVLRPIFSSYLVFFIWHFHCCSCWRFPDWFLFQVNAESIFLCLPVRHTVDSASHLQYSVRGRQRGTVSMSLLWQTVTGAVTILKTKTDPLYVCLWASFSVLLSLILHLHQTHNINQSTCKHTNVLIPHKVFWDLQCHSRQKAFGCWIFHISILDSFPLSVFWPSRWEVRYGLASGCYFGKM